MKKYDLDVKQVLMLFNINEQEINDLIFKLKNGIELNFLDILLIDRIKILNAIIIRRKYEKC